jgi:hypothetical protein
MIAEQAFPAGARPPRWLRWAGFAAGAALLAAAAWAVAGRRETFEEALASVRRPGAAEVVLLLGTILANVVLTGGVFSILMGRHGRVGRLEMQAVIATAGLLNVLPLRPGLLGRIAWHRTVDGIPVAATVAVSLQAAGLSVAIAGYLALALLGAATGLPLWLSAGLPVPVLAALWRNRFAAAALLRYLEVLALAARYHAAFTLIGAPVGAESALAFACVGVVAGLFPLAGSGLGVREWAVGLAAQWLTPYVLQQGLAADLLNRGAELLVTLILGLIGAAWLARLRARGPSP